MKIADYQGGSTPQLGKEQADITPQGLTLQVCTEVLGFQYLLLCHRPGAIRRWLHYDHITVIQPEHTWVSTALLLLVKWENGLTDSWEHEILYIWKP